MLCITGQRHMIQYEAYYRRTSITFVGRCVLSFTLYDIDTAVVCSYSTITGKCNYSHFSEVRSVRLWNKSGETCILTD